MTNLRWWVGACIVLLSATTLHAAEANGAGRVKVASGEAFIVRGGQLLPARIGQEILPSDGLKTGEDGRLGVTLKDNTRVSLGPASEVRLESFMYNPGAGRMGLVLKFVRGVAAYVSGRIAKLSPDSIRLETPAAIVGVRGTTLTIRVAE
jgi:hypothetical protein